MGLFNVDLVRNEEGLWPVEVNPRYSASVEVLELCLGLKAVGLHVEACESRVVPKTFDSSAANVFCGKAVVYAERDGAVPMELEMIAREWNVVKGRPGLADLPRTGERMGVGQPVVTVISEGATMEEAEEEVRRRVEIVRRCLQR